MNAFAGPVDGGPLELGGGRPGGPRGGRLAKLALRVLLSALFLAVALAGIGVAKVGDALEHADPLLVGTALIALAGSHLIAATRWWLVLRGLGIVVPWSRAVRLFFVGLFFTNVLPSGFGGDAVRGVMLARSSGRPAVAGVSVLVDRIAAVWALVTLGGLATLTVSGELPDRVRTSVAVSVLAVGAASLVLLSRRTFRLAARLLARRPGLAQVLSGAADAVGTARRTPGLLLTAVGLSLLAQLCVSVAAWLLALSLDVHVSPLLLTATIPVALLATAVPTTINGFGVREAVFRALLVPAGVAADDAVAFSLLTVVAGALVSLPGLLLWATGRSAGTGPDC